MTKAVFWNTDWFFGVAAVVCLVLSNRARKLIPSLERKACDLGVVAGSLTLLDRTAVIVIGGQCPAILGRWRWSRVALARLAGPRHMLTANLLDRPAPVGLPPCLAAPALAASTCIPVFRTRTAWT
jgi:hypothetical protein